MDGSKTYFDTNVTVHHHFYFENTHKLLDIPTLDVAIGIPAIPDGFELGRMDIVVRLRKRSD